MTKVSGQRVESLWPVVIPIDGIKLWSDGRNRLVHQDGTVGGRDYEHRPSGTEREEILAGIARTRAYCERQLRELELAEQALGTL